MKGGRGKNKGVDFRPLFFIFFCLPLYFVFQKLCSYALAAFEKKKAASKGKWGGQAQGQRQGRKHKK